MQVHSIGCLLRLINNTLGLWRGKAKIGGVYKRATRLDSENVALAVAVDHCGAGGSSG